MSRKLTPAGMRVAVRNLMREHSDLFNLEPLKAEVARKRREVAEVVEPVWEKWAKEAQPVSEEDGEAITTEKQLDFAADDVASAWFKVRNSVIMSAFPGTPDQCCPALIAENALVRAEQALIDAFVRELELDVRCVYGKLRTQLLETLQKTPLVVGL